MIKVDTFLNCLRDSGVEFFAGVPDSLLKSFCAYVTDTCGANHVIPRTKAVRLDGRWVSLIMRSDSISKAITASMSCIGKVMSVKSGKTGQTCFATLGGERETVAEGFNGDGSDTLRGPHGEPYARKLHVRFDVGRAYPGTLRSTLHPIVPHVDVSKRCVNDVCTFKSPLPPPLKLKKDH